MHPIRQEAHANSSAHVNMHAFDANERKFKLTNNKLLLPLNCLPQREFFYILFGKASYCLMIPKRFEAIIRFSK